MRAPPERGELGSLLEERRGDAAGASLLLAGMVCTIRPGLLGDPLTSLALLLGPGLLVWLLLGPGGMAFRPGRPAVVMGVAGYLGANHWTSVLGKPPGPSAIIEIGFLAALILLIRAHRPSLDRSLAWTIGSAVALVAGLALGGVLVGILTGSPRAWLHMGGEWDRWQKLLFGALGVWGWCLLCSAALGRAATRCGLSPGAGDGPRFDPALAALASSWVVISIAARTEHLAETGLQLSRDLWTVLAGSTLVHAGTRRQAAGGLAGALFLAYLFCAAHRAFPGIVSASTTLLVLLLIAGLSFRRGWDTPRAGRDGQRPSNVLLSRALPIARAGLLVLLVVWFPARWSSEAALEQRLHSGALQSLYRGDPNPALLVLQDTSGELPDSGVHLSEAAVIAVAGLALTSARTLARAALELSGGGGGAVSRRAQEVLELVHLLDRWLGRGRPRSPERTVEALQELGKTLGGRNRTASWLLPMLPVWYLEDESRRTPGPDVDDLLMRVTADLATENLPQQGPAGPRQILHHGWQAWRRHVESPRPLSPWAARYVFTLAASTSPSGMRDAVDVVCGVETASRQALCRAARALQAYNQGSHGEALNALGLGKRPVSRPSGPNEEDLLALPVFAHLPEGARPDTAALAALVLYRARGPEAAEACLEASLNVWPDSPILALVFARVKAGDELPTREEAHRWLIGRGNPPRSPEENRSRHRDLDHVMGRCLWMDGSDWSACLKLVYRGFPSR